jgi:hypothetical protein
MWRRVDPVWTDVSEERIPSNPWADFSALKMGAKRRFTQALHGSTSQQMTLIIVTAV